MERFAYTSINHPLDHSRSFCYRSTENLCPEESTLRPLNYLLIH